MHPVLALPRSRVPGAHDPSRHYPDNPEGDHVEQARARGQVASNLQDDDNDHSNGCCMRQKPDDVMGCCFIHGATPCSFHSV